MACDCEQIKKKAAALAAKGVFIGTSSWKYEGWFGQLYTLTRYEYRGKVAKTRFEREDAVPDDFRFGFKVTDTVTIKKFPKLDRFGAKAGRPNSDFLNADLFATAFLKPCEGIHAKVGVLMFEFSQFWPSDYEHGRDFVADLEKFLCELPKGWPYAIEMRYVKIAIMWSYVS
jgi:uncharacterized protein YecE (DUF72 family)